MRLRCALLALPALLVACGDRAGEPGEGALPAMDPPRVAREAAPLATAPAALPVPAALVAACVSGDPIAGTSWTLRQVDDALVPLGLEAIESLASRDSARLAARISRAVDVLPSDTSIADFRGLPVSVRAGWRFTAAPGDTVVVALVARRLPMESNPLEELFFLVAAPGERQGVRDPLVEGLVIREVAPEETIAVRELLVAYVSDGEVTLVIAHDAGSGVRAELVSRRGAKWRVDWSGPLPACAP